MERFKVTFKEIDMEPVVPFDRFGLDNEEYENWPEEMAKNLGLNEKSPSTNEALSGGASPIKVDNQPDYITDVPTTHMLYGAIRGAKPVSEKPTATYDYTDQLEFHKQEVADAEERGMPEAQVNYHLGKIAVLQNIPKPPRGEEPKQHNPDCKKDGGCSCGR